MDRTLSQIERAEAQRRIEVDESLLRGLRLEAQRMRARMGLLEGEIAGAKQVIADKQRQIGEASEQLEELRQRLAKLEEHEAKLRDDAATWNERLAG